MIPYKIKFHTVVKFFLATAVIGVAISYSKLYLFHFALILTLLFFLHTRHFKVEKLEVRFQWVFYLMFIWYILSISWCNQKIFALQYIFYLFCGISTALIIIYHADTDHKLGDIFKILKLLFIIEIIIAILESLNIIRLPISPYSNIVDFFGRDSKLPGLSGHLQILFTHTPTGFTWNQNNLAMVMNLILPFFLFAKKNWVKVVGAISIYFIIYKTLSRGNIIAYFMILAIFILFVNRYKWIFRGLSVLIILISLIIGLNFKFDSSPIGDAIGSVETLLTGKVQEKNSIGLRQRYIINGVDALKKTYGLGVGAGNSGNAEYHPDVSEGSSHISMHNFWIEVLVDGGIVFALIFYTWYLLMIYSLLKVSKKVPKQSDLKYYSRASALSLFGFIFGAISASSVIYDLPMWILFGFSIAVINIYRIEKSDMVSPTKNQIS